MTPQEKYKEIAVAFAAYCASTTVINASNLYDSWVQREEGKRLTAEEPDERDAIIKLYQTKDINDRAYQIELIQEAIKPLKEQLDRFEGRCTVTVSELHTRINNPNE